jgi:aldehyde dehydrogenase (NAD+)
MRDCRKFYIDGAWVEATTRNELPVLSPATEEPIGTISLGAPADVDSAVAAAARHAFETFSATGREERLALLGRIVDVYKRHEEYLELKAVFGWSPK